MLGSAATRAQQPGFGVETAMNWVLFGLLLHIAAAIIAFGPIFVFPLMEPTLKARPAGIGFACC
jgi:hypothetical protein